MTQTEAEALHLEQNLVKRHRPPFNVRLRDDKSFPYIAVTVADEYPRVHLHARAAPQGERLLRPVREREEGARDARRAQPRVPVPAVRGAEAGSPLGHPVPRLPHRALHCAVHPGHLGGGLRRDHRRGDRLPLRRHEADQARAARRGCRRLRPRSASRTRRGTATACSRSRASPREQAADRRDVGDVDVIGLAVEGEAAAVQVFPLRGGRLIDRYAFHLDNASGPGSRHDPRVVLPRVLLGRAHGAARGARAVRARGHGAARAVPLRPPWHAGRGARAAARREAPARRARGRERGARARAPGDGCRAASGSGGSRRSSSSARRSTSRACRCGSSASTCRTSRAARSWPRWRCSRTRSRGARTTARSACTAWTGRTTSRRWRRRSRGASRGCATRRRPSAGTRASPRCRTSS